MQLSSDNEVNTLKASMLTQNKKFGELVAVKDGWAYLRFMYSPENQGVSVPISMLPELIKVSPELPTVLTLFKKKTGMVWVPSKKNFFLTVPFVKGGIDHVGEIKYAEHIPSGA